MNARGLFLSVATGAFYSLLMPLSTILLLGAEHYGLFSAIYLIFAFGISLQYSLVSEVWARISSELPAEKIWKPYSSALVLVAGFGLISTTIFCFLYPKFLTGIVMMGIAVFMGILRSGIRYFEVANNRILRVLLSDSLGICVFGTSLILGWGRNPFDLISLAWLLSSTSTLFAFRAPKFSGVEGLYWFRSKRAEIKPLLADSLMLDFSAIVVPYLTMFKLGLSEFGIYRGIASAAVPVRLIIDPLRPYFGKQSPQAILRTSVFIRWILIGLFLGLFVFSGLSIIEYFPALKFSTLSELFTFRFEAAIYTVASFISMLLYIVARTHLGAQRLIRARLYQTLLVSVFPLIGVAFGGLDWAIWGFVTSNVICIFLWYSELYKSR